LPNEEEVGTLNAYPGDPNRLGAVRREGEREEGREERGSLWNEEEVGTLNANPGDPNRLGAVRREGGREGGRGGGLCRMRRKWARSTLTRGTRIDWAR